MYPFSFYHCMIFKNYILLCGIRFDGKEMLDIRASSPVTVSSKSVVLRIFFGQSGKETAPLSVVVCLRVVLCSFLWGKLSQIC